MEILHPIIQPYRIMNAGPAQSFQAVVHVRKRHPSSAEHISQQCLVWKVVGGGPALVFESLHDGVAGGGGGVENNQSAVWHCRFDASGRDAMCLRRLRVRMLQCIRAVFRDPIPGIVRLLERIAEARVGSREDKFWPEIEVHELVHVLGNEHVGVQKDKPVVLSQGEDGQLSPAVIEAGIIAVVPVHTGEEDLDALFGDASPVQRVVAFFRKGVGEESHERVARANAPERVFKDEEAGEILGIGDEGDPGCASRQSQHPLSPSRRHQDAAHRASDRLTSPRCETVSGLSIHL